MEFMVEHSSPSNPFHGQISCRYMDLITGETKIRTQAFLHDREDRAEWYVDRVKEQMKREITQELGQQAVEIQEHRQMATLNNHTHTMVTYATPEQHWQDAVQYQRMYQHGVFGTALSDTTAQMYTQVQMSTALPIHFMGIDPCGPVESEIEIEFPLGKRMLTMRKKAENGKVVVTMEDIGKAITDGKEQFMFSIHAKKAENRAENLLQTMISEIDFRNYKEKGYFTCQENGKLYRIYKDKSKWVDLWEAKEVKAELIWQPKNRLCTHTESRDLPDADEALSKLMLIRSGRIIEHANLHPVKGTRGLEMKQLKHENELILI